MHDHAHAKDRGTCDRCGNISGKEGEARASNRRHRSLGVQEAFGEML